MTAFDLEPWLPAIFPIIGFVLCFVVCLEEVVVERWKKRRR